MRVAIDVAVIVDRLRIFDALGYEGAPVVLGGCFGVGHSENLVLGCDLIDHFCELLADVIEIIHDFIIGKSDDF